MEEKNVSHENKVTRVTKGFDIPIVGKAEKKIREGSDQPLMVAVKPPDFPGFRPKLLVKQGDPVSIGTPLVEDKKNAAIRLVSPGGGKVAAIIRGERRKLEIISVELDEKEQYESYPSWKPQELSSLSRETIIKQILAGGLWPLLKQRPYGKIANPDVTPRSIFVSGMNTEPLAADPEFLLKGKDEALQAGLTLIAKLTEGATYLCIAGDCSLPALTEAKRVEVRRFSGPHPAGLVSTHIQTIEPFRKGDMVWHLGAVEVALIGELFLTGRFPTERLVAVVGPGVKEPCYATTRAGAPLLPIVGETTDASLTRYISGTILTGQEEAQDDFLGLSTTSLTVLPHNRERKFLGWLMPQMDTFSWFPLFGGHFKRKLFPFGTMIHSGPRAVLPIGCHEELTPLDIYPTFLIKSILVGDLEEAESLGLLECTEEDLALITYVDPSKMNYGEILRKGLDRHEKEG